MNIIVMKFGGAAVATSESFSQIAEIISERKKENQRVVVVVSAMGNTTNQLIALAKQVHPDPPRREYDMLVSVGERISISLLAMALALRQEQAISFTGSQSGIITCSSHSEARIIDVRPHRILPYLEQNKVVIVAGFQGVSSEGQITTLGRGGSDTTAVALAAALGAEKVEFYKDVPGMFTDDPKKNPTATLHRYLTYDEAIHVVRSGGKILHTRCLMLAKRNQLPLCVRSFKECVTHKDTGTVIEEYEKQRPLQPLYEEEGQLAEKICCASNP